MKKTIFTLNQWDIAFEDLNPKYTIKRNFSKYLLRHNWNTINNLIQIAPNRTMETKALGTRGVEGIFGCAKNYNCNINEYEYQNTITDVRCKLLMDSCVRRNYNSVKKNTYKNLHSNIPLSQYVFLRMQKKNKCKKLKKSYRNSELDEAYKFKRRLEKRRTLTIRKSYHFPKYQHN